MTVYFVSISYRHGDDMLELLRVERGDTVPLAVEAAREWFGEHASGEYHSEVVSAPEDTYLTYVPLQDLPVVWGRVCALEAIDNGYPGILDGTLYGDWLKTHDLPTEDDCQSLDDAMAGYPERASDALWDGRTARFAESFRKSLFYGADTIEREDDEEDCACAECQAAREIAEADAYADPEQLFAEAETEAAAECADNGESTDGSAYYAILLPAAESLNKPGWDEGARSAGCFEMRAKAGSPRSREAYYAAYETAACARAQELYQEIVDEAAAADEE